MTVITFDPTFRSKKSILFDLFESNTETFDRSLTKKQGSNFTGTDLVSF